MRLPCLILLALIPALHAANPFLTDDPEPVELHHWEFYFATLDTKSSGNWTGTAPHLEINYGALPNLELHLLAPMVFDKPRDAPGHIGYGDTELSVKYRLAKGGEIYPQLAIVPTVELPTGNHDLGLGNGRAQVFLPVSLQKTFGPWLTYGEAGWWYHPGDAENRDYWFMGWELQRKITETFTLGTEIFHKTAEAHDSGSKTIMDLGAIWDLSSTYHLMISAGHSIQGPAEFTGYFAFQITLGPDDARSSSSLK